MVLLQNLRDCPAEWQVKAPLEAGGAKDWDYFKCEPDEGILAPGQKLFMKVCCAVAVSLCIS